MRGNETFKFHDLLIFSPGEPLFMDLSIPKYFSRYKKHYGRTFENIIFRCINKLEILNFKMLDQLRKRRAPKHDEDPSNKISKNLDVGSISIRKHEIEVW